MGAIQRLSIGRNWKEPSHHCAKSAKSPDEDRSRVQCAEGEPRNHCLAKPHRIPEQKLGGSLWPEGHGDRPPNYLLHPPRTQMSLVAR